MQLGIVRLKKGHPFNPEAFKNAKLTPIAVADNHHFLVRIDDDSLTAETDFVENIEMISGSQKKQLLDTYRQYGAVSIAVAN